MIERCLPVAREIVQYVEPKTIFVVGFSSYNYLKKSLATVGTFEEETNINGVKQRVAIQSQINEIRIFAIRHLTGSRISTADKDIARKHFFGSVTRYSNSS